MESETTNLAFDQILEEEIRGWNEFRRALRKDDQQVFDHFFEKVKCHVEAGKNASKPWPFDIILISILLEQEKESDELRKKMEG